jgi:MscS family membrane protein
MTQDFFATTIQGNTIEEWLIALAIFAGSIILSRVFYFISTRGFKKLFEKLKNRFLYIVTDMLEEPIALILVIVGFYVAERRLNLPLVADGSIDKAILFVSILVVTWMLARLLNDLISEYLVPFVAKSESKLDDQILPIMRKSVKVLIWIIGIIVALDNVGYNVATIVAGLGIGGLAFAFAAQETIANLFGGITIFIDAPFVIGDRIKINGYEGWVREIGLRTAKLETLDGRRLTMPNSAFSKNVIENVSSEPATRAMQTIGIACNQNVATVEKALETLRGILSADSDLEQKSTAYFQKFGDSSFDLGIVLWIKKGADYLGTISRVNLEIVRAFERERIEIALPVRYIVQPKG